MSLRTADTIVVPTDTGEYQIQLCYGDITKQQEKMDIIMVSAFPGDYAAIGGTLIGALKRNLNINVGVLARNKDMDLRTHFSCWISKELDQELPFRRLMCFERSKAKGDVIDQIREMFRVFVPACGNQETTVITPLLGTGNQGFSESVVLSCMVEAAENWMQAGLPLKCIKICIYETDNADLNELFMSLKKKFMDREKKKSGKFAKVELTYDVFITFEESDKEWVSMVTNKLKSKNKELKIFSDLVKFDKKKVWQDSIFKIMTCSHRIIALLTPSFVNSDKCIDQFNMAMCCNRLKNSELLFPFLLTTVESMPVYMQLVQYFDCRIRKETDVMEVKLESACTYVLHPTSVGYIKSEEDIDNANERFQYDVFISYSHRQPKQAEELLQRMTTANSDLKIFFDRSELTMGSMWQSSLYESLDRSECVIALVSNDYFSSIVCQEEYNIALARHLAYPAGVLFIPILVESIETIPSQFSRIGIIDATGDKFVKVTEDLTQKIIDWRINKTKIPYIQKPVDKFSFSHHESKRKLQIESQYRLNTKMKCLEPCTRIKTITPSKNGKIDIAISFARDTLAYALAINGIFTKNNEDLNISFLNENAHGSLQDLDTAKQIIVILSKEYTQSPNHMQELHVALCRQRESKTKLVVRILADKELPENPMFIHLLPLGTVLSDAVWTRYGKKSGNLKEQKSIMSYKPGMKGSFMIPYEIYYGLEKMAYDVMISLCRSDSEDMKEEVPKTICSNILEIKLRDIDYPQTVQVSECLIDIISEKPYMQIKKVENTEKVLDEEPETEYISESTYEETKETSPKKINEKSNAKAVEQIPKKTKEELNIKLKEPAIEEVKDEQEKVIEQTTNKEHDDENKTGVVVQWADELNAENQGLKKKALEEMKIREQIEKDILKAEAKTSSKSCSIL